MEKMPKRQRASHMSKTVLMKYHFAQLKVEDLY